MDPGKEELVQEESSEELNGDMNKDVNPCDENDEDEEKAAIRKEIEELQREYQEVSNNYENMIDKKRKELSSCLNDLQEIVTLCAQVKDVARELTKDAHANTAPAMAEVRKPKEETALSRAQMGKKVNTKPSVDASDGENEYSD